MTRTTWVIGSGGLIGRSIAAAMASGTPSGSPFRPSGTVPWGDPDRAVAVLRTQLAEFARVTRSQSWAIAWAAGAGTVSSDIGAMQAETRTLQGFLAALREATPDGPGALLLASSAGGLYGGCPDPPFDETDEPRPISAYGIEKLRQEDLARMAAAGRLTLILARFSNVYGPHQNLAKSQGLISRLALAAVTRQPVNLFVPLDTIRDYIHVDDAAAAAARWLDLAVERAIARTAPEAEVRIIASGRATTVAELVGIASDIARRRIPVAMGTHASARLQAPDLRFIPSAPPGERLPSMSLPVGIKTVVDAVLRQQQHGATVAVG